MVKPVLRVALFYLVFGVLWIIITDFTLQLFTTDTVFQTIKGLFFVIVSTIVIIFLAHREIKKKNQLIFLFNESKKLYTDLVSNLPDINIYLVDKDLKHIIAHGTAMAEFLYDPSSVRGKTLDEISIEPKFGQLLKSHYITILKGEKVIHEFNLIDKWFEFRGMPVKDEKSEIIAAAVTITNITEKKQYLNNLFGQKTEIESLYEEYVSINEELMDSINKLSKANIKLEASEKKYRMFFENINDAAYIHEVNENFIPGVFIEINQKFIEQVGFTREELLKMHPYEIATPESLEKFKISGFWGQDRQHQYFEMEHVTKKGKIIPVEISLHFFEDDGKKMVFAIVRDIRERVKYIKKLKKAKEKAEESDRLKSAFLANISHEIRTPLNGIIGFSELLSQLDLSKSQKAGYTGLIKKSSDQLLKVINDILEISKIETGQLMVFNSDFSLNQLLDDLKNELDDLIGQNNKNIKTHLEKSFLNGEDIIYTDKEKVKQVLRYILNNAEKFTKEGNIEFGYSVSENNTILFYVKDTGIGLSAEKHKLVFERFRQADDSHSREYGGTGLGLPIAKALIELLGGDISIKSELNEGTLIEFSVRFEFAKNLEKEETKELSGDPDLGGRKVLVVEDDSESSLLLSEYLYFCNANVLKASKGQEALEISKTNNPDLIFMDIRLPDMDGLEVTKEVRKIMPSAYIIAQTAYASDEDRQKCFDAGCNDYLSKPIDKNILYNSINKYLYILYSNLNQSKSE